MAAKILDYEDTDTKVHKQTFDLLYRNVINTFTDISSKFMGTVGDWKVAGKVCKNAVFSTQSTVYLCILSAVLAQAI